MKSSSSSGDKARQVGSQVRTYLASLPPDGRKALRKLREIIRAAAPDAVYSTNPDAQRAFLRDVLRLPHVDVGHGWLIFGLPPSELAVHPSDKSHAHELLAVGKRAKRSLRRRSDRIGVDPAIPR